MSKQDIKKRLGFAAQGVKETTRTSAKAEMGFLSRVGYAATALTADPADPKSAEYRKQVSEAKAAAKDAITNYKFMRDKVKERLAALDAYVTNAIKVINSATSAKDIEHYVEQLRIAVKSQSMILGASKSPFSRPGVKAKMAAPANWESKLDAKNLADSFNVEGLRELLGSAKEIARKYPQYKALGQKMADGINMVLSAVKQMKAESMKSSRPGVKAKMSKATDALAFIKSSIESGRTVYIQTPRGGTKVSPKTYAAWEASGRPLFKIGKDGALLMASGSSYNRLTMGEDEMLVRVSAMSRPTVKAKA